MAKRRGFEKPEFDFGEYASELIEQQINPMDPIEWARKKAGVQLWSKQREIGESVVKNRLTAVKSGHGVGKSFTTSLLATWWIDTHPYDDTLVISTAPSTRQVSAIMWEEIRKIHRRAGLPGVVQRSDRWLINDVEVGFGRKPQDYDQHAFQGLHREYLLVIIDEACGVDEWLWIAALSMATGDNCRIIAIGNPDDPSSYFSKVCKPSSGWNVIQISVFDSPNFTGEEVTEDARKKLTNQQWIEDMEREVGRDTPTWTAKVLGEFPDIDEMSVIPLSWVYRAQERWQEWHDNGKFIPKNSRHVVGADIARFGGDRTVFAHRHGHVVTELKIAPKGDTERTADELASELTGPRPATGVVDTNGVGAGVYDKLRRKGKHVVSYASQARTSLKDSSGQIEFYNVRAASMWRFREALDPGRGATICLPPDEKLAVDLSTPRWKTMAGGKLVVESKDDVRKRIGRSPDRGDAVIITDFVNSSEAIGTDDASFDWVTDDNDGESFYDDDGAVAWAGIEAEIA